METKDLKAFFEWIKSDPTLCKLLKEVGLEIKAELEEKSKQWKKKKKRGNSKYG